MQSIRLFSDNALKTPSWNNSFVGGISHASISYDQYVYITMSTLLAFEPTDRTSVSDETSNDTETFLNGWGPVPELPSLAEITSVFEDLTVEQEEEVVRVIEKLRYIDEDNFSVSNRTAKREHLQDARKGLNKFLTEMEELGKIDRNAIKEIYSDFLACLLTRSALAELTKTSIPAQSARILVREPNSKRSRLSSNEQIEYEQMLINRRRVDQAASKIFLNLIERMQSLLDAYLADNRHLPIRGHPADHVRENRLFVLALLFADFMGLEPTTTPSGAYLTLCNDVFEHIGANTDGLDQAVQRVWPEIKQMQSS